MTDLVERFIEDNPRLFEMGPGLTVEIDDLVEATKEEVRCEKRTLDRDADVVKAAKRIAKRNGFDFREILKRMTPSNNIVRFTSWDSQGNPCKVKH